MQSCVMFEGMLSNWINLEQSVRKGGVLSAWLYLVCIDGLLYELENAKIGCTIGGTFFGAPMQAEDLSLLYSAKSDMDKMLNICNNYSKRWRYELNPSKSNILVFGESKQTQKRHSKERDWSISNSPIVENITGKHVGVLLQCDMKSTERTLSACRRLRSTFMSIVGIGANPDFMYPLTAKRLYLSICIPRALFGCEIWGSLSYSGDVGKNAHFLHEIYSTI